MTNEKLIDAAERTGAFFQIGDRILAAFARDIASWDQGVEQTERIPHWAVNLAIYLMDLGYSND